MIHLRPMTEPEYQAFLETTTRSYAEEKVAAGTWKPEEALSLATQSRQKSLPEGRQTPNNHLLSIIYSDSGEKDVTVGFLWFVVHENGPVPSAFIYQFGIFEPYRRKHYGSEAFQALEKYVLPLEVKKLELHVFAHNHAALSLYEKLGYSATDINMAKTIQ